MYVYIYIYMERYIEIEVGRLTKSDNSMHRLIDREINAQMDKRSEQNHEYMEANYTWTQNQS